MGVTNEVLMYVLVILTIILLLIFAFNFVGIKAFAITGTFGSNDNSVFQVGKQILFIFKFNYFKAGGGGLSNANKVDVKEMFNIKKLKQIVDKCIAIVQSIKR